MKDKNKHNAYQREYQLKRYHSRRTEAIEYLGGRCVCCGSTQDLEIDHIDPDTKDFDLATLWSVSKKRYDEELRKCQLLCDRCHNEKTIDETGKILATDRNGRMLRHGTLSSYRYCKCDLCKKVKADYMKKYHKKRSLLP